MYTVSGAQEHMWRDQQVTFKGKKDSVNLRFCSSLKNVLKVLKAQGEIKKNEKNERIRVISYLKIKSYKGEVVYYMSLLNFALD